MDDSTLIACWYWRRNFYTNSSAYECECVKYTNLLEKYPNSFLCENLVYFNEARLHEGILNIHTHAWIFHRLSLAPVDGKQHLSEVAFSDLVGFSLYTTSKHHRVKQSPKSTIGMSSVAYVMLCSARDQSCGNWCLHHDNAPTLSSDLIQTFLLKTRLLWFVRLLTLLIRLPATSGCFLNSRDHRKESDFRQGRTLWLQQQLS